MRCNLCGCSDFSDMPKRPRVRCIGCGSLERTRVAGLYVGALGLAPGSRILHFAPERGLSAVLRTIGGNAYRALDIEPSKYPFAAVEPFDLCRDVFGLEAESCDLIVHNHVLEHVECNYSAVLLGLVRALKPAGTMLFSMPILPGPFIDELMSGTIEQKRERFGTMLHVRCFGANFIQQTIGMLFRVPDRYDLTRAFTPAVLSGANIPEHHWLAFTGASVFRVGHGDLRV